MKAVILCAGVGSRLGALTANRPKALLPIGSQTVLDRMLLSLQQHGIDSFVIVVGHQREQIEAHVKIHWANCPYPQLPVQFIVNPRFAETNTSYSLLLAREAIGSDSFVKLDGDLVFEDDVLAKLFADQTTNRVVVDSSVILGDEEVKVVAQEGAIQRIGKKLTLSQCRGESIGIELIHRDSVGDLFSELARVVCQDQLVQEYYELAYDRMMQRGVPFRLVDITGLKWNEIDDLTDLQRAREMFLR